VKREPIPEQDRARLYEAEKSEWVRTHQNATPREYEQAMLSIAKRIGF